MSPSIAPPAPEVLQQLLAEHALRYPEKATVDAIGDGGVTLRLPLLIGNPTGSTRTPGPRVLPAWSDFVALTLGAKKTGADTIGEEVARDCLLFPSPALLAEWEQRWPAILGAIGSITLSKIGADAKLVRMAPLPEAPSRYLLGTGAGVEATVTTPSKAHYDGLRASVKREGADCIELLDELIAVCVKGTGVSELLVRRPGLALPLYNTAMRLAGAVADARLGEW